MRTPATSAIPGGASTNAHAAASAATQAEHTSIYQYIHSNIQSFTVYEIRAADMQQKRAHTFLHMHARVLCFCFAPMSRSAPPLAPTLMFAAPDGTFHPLIDLCGDRSEDEAADGGLLDAFVEVGDALALAVDASEDDECEEVPARAGL